MSHEPFSVLLAIYEGDDPDALRRSLDSVFDQSVEPDEVVVVEDGPITPALEAVLQEFEQERPDVLVRTALETNQGLGAALNHGIQACSHDLVARHDADDVAMSDRFELQLEYLAEHPEVDVVGGYIAEFSSNPENVGTVREVPSEPDEVRSYAKYRCPMNHPSVMYRRQSVLEAGNYRPLRSMQDYDLWMRMLSEGFVLTNLPEVIVHCEAGSDLYQRRGGLSKARLELELQYRFLKLGMVPVPIFILNIGARIPMRLAPKSIRKFVYRSILRN